MMKYIKSEWIKNRKSFAVKMLVIVPVVTVVLAMIMMMGTNVQMLAYNWWYIIFLPFAVAYVSVHMVSSERKKNYHGLFGLVQRKQDLGYGKIIVATVYLMITNAVFFVLIGIVGVIFESQIGLLDNLIAGVVLTLTFAWQIPLILLLALKLNGILAVVISVVCNMGMMCFCAPRAVWWLPFAIPARMMCLILGILPNGLWAEDISLFGDKVTIVSGILITLMMYAVMTFCCGKAFHRQEA